MDVKVGLKDDILHISLEPNSVSEKFTLKYRTSGWNFFGSGSLLVTVQKYVNATVTVTNDEGVAIDRTELKKSTNVIVIDKDPNAVGADIFTINFE